MAKKQKTLEYLMQLAKQGTKAFNIRGQKFTEEESFEIVTVMIILFQNPVIVANYIVPLLKDLMKQYNEDIVKISKVIISETPQLRDEENMRRFTLYLLGKNFSDSFNKMSKDEKENYLLNIAQGFGVFGEDRVLDMLKYLTEIMYDEKEPSDTIKRIAVSDFKDNEIDYMILARGLF